MSDPMKVHKVFLGDRPITPVHLALYQGSGRGFSSHEPTSDMLEALVIKALGLAKEEGAPVYYSVFLYAHHKLQSKIGEAIVEVGLRLKARISNSPPEKRRSTLKIGKQWLGALRIGVPSMKDLQQLPEKWLVVGYTKDDPIPSHVSDSLICL